MHKVAGTALAVVMALVSLEAPAGANELSVVGTGDGIGTARAERAGQKAGQLTRAGGAGQVHESNPQSELFGIHVEFAHEVDHRFTVGRDRHGSDQSFFENGSRHGFGLPAVG